MKAANMAWLCADLRASMPDLSAVREADGDTFAPELDAHGPGLCIRPRCRRVACVALKNDILVRHGYTKVPA